MHSAYETPPKIVKNKVKLESIFYRRPFLINNWITKLQYESS